MKVCPECQARFAGNEMFCPNDATRLVDERQLSPATLSQTDLTPQIHLERLEFSDRLGERYRGHLRTDQTPLRVTVCNQGFIPDAGRLTALAERRAQLGELLPAEILGLHSLDLKSDTVFIAEQAPQGPSLQVVLNERKALNWQTAIRLTCGVGRVLEYLAERGLILLGLGTHAIFVTDLKQGQVQVGEWAHSLLAHPTRPLELDADAPDTFLGYPAYLAPEAIRDAGDADQRSLVYTLGNLLYQLITGKAAFTSKTSADVLKRHLHEQPLKLSIAHGGAGLPPELDHLLGLMWHKDPERRFKRLSAAMVALCSLVSESLDEVAPPLVPAENPVFETDVLQATLESDDASASADLPTDAAAPQKDDVPPGEEPVSETRTIMGMPAIAITAAGDLAAREEPAQDEPAQDESAHDESAQDDAPREDVAGQTEPTEASAQDAPADDTAEVSADTASTSADEPAATAPQAAETQVAAVNGSEPDAAAAPSADADVARDADDASASALPASDGADDEQPASAEASQEATRGEVPEDADSAASAPAADTSDAPGSIIIDDPELRAAAAAIETDDGAEDAARTLDSASALEASHAVFMGTIGDEVQKAADAVKQRNGLDADAGSSHADADAQTDDSESQADVDDGAEKDDKGDTDNTGASARTDRKRKKDKKNKKKDKGRSGAPKPEAAPEAAPEATAKADAAPADEVPASREASTEAQPKEDAPAKEAGGAEENEPEEAARKSSFEVGFLEVQNDGGGEFAESWFGADANQSWEHSQALAGHEYAENRHKYITFGIIGGIGLLVLIFVVSLQFYTVEPTNTRAVEVDEAAEQEAWKAQAQALRRDFDEAIDSGHLIRPFRDSAINTLEKLKSHVRDDVIFTEARDIFVKHAMAAARRNEEENLGYAADLAGYASQMAREDKEVKAYAEKLRNRLESGHARAPADAPNEEEASDQEEAPADAPPEEDMPAAAPVPEEPATPPPPAPARPESSKPAAPPPKTTTAPATRALATILADARTARNQNRMDDAARFYREALGQAPNNGPANTGLGDLLFDQAKYAEAVRYYKKASDGAPRNVDYALNLGKTHFKLNQFRDAQRAWQRALAQDPNNAAAQRYMKLIEGKL